ncbi:hypothetical protein O6H91_18G041100 [Diphasiastrum complanatum]|uniref:Uncharacterized protein n=1 Tax=Diphasiastrum complanatum TaxID=34168 RepID=A0ACC2B090_DIPCM|nr:hypothetical protein O6H91_18G041100 [Diphasiastrum complanatum]
MAMEGEGEGLEEQQVMQQRADPATDRDCVMETAQEEPRILEADTDEPHRLDAAENRDAEVGSDGRTVTGALADNGTRLEPPVDRAFSTEAMAAQEEERGQQTVGMDCQQNVGMDADDLDPDGRDDHEEQVIWQNEAMAYTDTETHAPHAFHADLHDEAHEIDSMEEKNEEDDDVFEGSIEEQMTFSRELDAFFRERNMEFKPPKFYGEELNCLKLWRAVVRLGGYDQVTAGKLWRQVGESFKPPKRCTTVSWSFRGFYEKALLDYERWKMGTSMNSSYQEKPYLDTTFKGDENQEASSPNTLSQPCAGIVSALGRARRDAAARAMQGWHSQRIGNGEVGEPIIKDKSAAKREKRLKNAGALKRKDHFSFEGSVKAPRIKGARTFGHEENFDDAGKYNFIASIPKKKVGRPELVKQVLKIKHDFRSGIDPLIIDEGPEADWVKINVHQTRDCFEVYALVPGLLREEVRIQCEAGGRLVIAGEPEQPENPWGVTAFRKVISLPMRIDAHQTSAVVTLHGQLFVRVPFALSE